LSDGKNNFEKIKNMNIELLEGDCTFEHKAIKDGSVDLILTDLPYGTVTNIASSETVKHGMQNKTNWDCVIETEKIYEIANRILRKNGKMVLFAQQPFTTELINKAHKNLPFNYSMIWKKDHFANSLIAKKAPLNYYEDVLVFSKKYDTEINPIQTYMLDEFIKCGKPISFYKELCGFTGNQPYNWFSPKNDGTKQWAFPIKKHYEKLSITGYFLKPFEEIEEMDLKYRATFNLWEGGKFKNNILEYKKDYDGLHPTQKPILLLEDLIKTFSNENDLVVDLTMGSGSTAIACMNTNRNFKGIEKDFNYFDVSKKRVEKKRKEKDLQAETLFGTLM
jgi:DNA modification methylase